MRCRMEGQRRLTACSTVQCNTDTVRDEVFHHVLCVLQHQSATHRRVATPRHPVRRDVQRRVEPLAAARSTSRRGRCTRWRAR
jgi:hypothetical protein